ncbi:MAG TPA: ATP-binding protein [Solirubrobacteraceae bacterium]|jgi:anti-sigma regulatory factor (Ser/Thr protein kinase)
MSVVGNTHNASYPAVRESISPAREALVRLASAAGATAEQLESIRLATSEVLTNVVLHAYRGRPGRIQVTAAAVAEELLILISDDGRGLHARNDSPGLGLGLVLVSQVADDFSIGSRSEGGTEVQIRFCLDGTRETAGQDQLRGSVMAASRPASARFSTTM